MLFCGSDLEVAEEKVAALSGRRWLRRWILCFGSYVTRFVQTSSQADTDTWHTCGDMVPSMPLTCNITPFSPYFLHKIIICLNWTSSLIYFISSFKWSEKILNPVLFISITFSLFFLIFHFKIVQILYYFIFPRFE